MPACPSKSQKLWKKQCFSSTQFPKFQHAATKTARNHKTEALQSTPEGVHLHKIHKLSRPRGMILLMNFTGRPGAILVFHYLDQIHAFYWSFQINSLCRGAVFLFLQANTDSARTTNKHTHHFRILCAVLMTEWADDITNLQLISVFPLLLFILFLLLLNDDSSSRSTHGEIDKTIFNTACNRLHICTTTV